MTTTTRLHLLPLTTQLLMNLLHLPVVTVLTRTYIRIAYRSHLQTFAVIFLTLRVLAVTTLPVSIYHLENHSAVLDRLRFHLANGMPTQPRPLTFLRQQVRLRPPIVFFFHRTLDKRTVKVRGAVDQFIKNGWLFRFRKIRLDNSQFINHGTHGLPLLNRCIKTRLSLLHTLLTV